jgi:hypothetical protein
VHRAPVRIAEHLGDRPDERHGIHLRHVVKPDSSLPKLGERGGGVRG